MFENHLHAPKLTNGDVNREANRQHNAEQPTLSSIVWDSALSTALFSPVNWTRQQNMMTQNTIRQSRDDDPAKDDKTHKQGGTDSVPPRATYGVGPEPTTEMPPRAKAETAPETPKSPRPRTTAGAGPEKEVGTRANYGSDWRKSEGNNLHDPHFDKRDATKSGASSTDWRKSEKYNLHDPYFDRRVPNAKPGDPYYTKPKEAKAGEMPPYKEIHRDIRNDPKQPYARKDTPTPKKSDPIDEFLDSLHKMLDPTYKGKPKFHTAGRF